jgi:hypothetical protein
MGDGMSDSCFCQNGRDRECPRHGDSSWSFKTQKLQETKNQISKEAMDLVLICAQDIVNAWPALTMRTLGTMTNRIDTLRQALEAAAQK